MLEQRRAQKKGFITLREAADFAGYTPDYVGQLIRAGKIKGEQVYSGTAWMTTKEEIQYYLSNKQRTVKPKNASSKLFLLNLIKHMRERHLTLVFVVFFGIAILLMQYAIYLALSTDGQYGSGGAQSEVALRENS